MSQSDQERIDDLEFALHELTAKPGPQMGDLDCGRCGCPVLRGRHWSPRATAHASDCPVGRVLSGAWGKEWRERAAVGRDLERVSEEAGRK